MNHSNSLTIRQAGISDLEVLVPLFDAYRVFYGKTSDRALAHSFLLERFRHQQSVIFLALDDNVAANGFTQLYPSFSSLSAARTFVLNDLYVLPEARRDGAATRLLAAAAAYGRAVGALQLSLATAISNQPAQSLYASRGWIRDDDFLTYNLTLQPPG